MRGPLLSIASILAPLTVLAQSASNPLATVTATPAPVSTAGSMAQMTLGLLVVLGLVFAMAWMLRRFKLFGSRGQIGIEVLQGVSLGNKERAVVIRVQGRRLLLGVAPGCVSLLTELADDAVVGDAGAEQDCTVDQSTMPAVTSAPSFKDLLKRSMGLSQ